jgi:hypothetical protein
MRYLIALTAMAPVAAAAHPGHGPDFHAMGVKGWVTLALIVVAAACITRALEKRGA